MVPSLAALFAVASLLGGADALTHYPPAPDSKFNLTWAVNGTGAPGIFDSSDTPKKEYGTYNWCNMPHVRKSEYPVPPKEYHLKYLEVIQRHHKRTPYASNTFFKEDIPWECDNEGPYAHAKSSKKKTSKVFWQALTGSQNPFEYTVGPGFEGSTCRFPSITSQGIEDSIQHGKDFRGVYGSLLKFLPKAKEKNKYAFRVTNNVITSQTLSGFARGLYPEVDEYPAWIASSVSDSLEPAFSCPYANVVNKAYEANSPDWQAHLNASSEVRARFDAVSGIPEDDTGGWHTSWDHPFDNLSAKQCHQKPLPCNVNNTAICVSQQDTDTIYRLGQYEYAYRWRGAENSTLYAALKMGPWFTELKSHLLDAADGTSERKYLHNFAHDGSVSAVLGILQLAYPVWPGMGSEIVFEVWEKREKKDRLDRRSKDKKGQHYLRVLWNGQPMQTSTPLGTLDMVKLEDFVAYIEDTIPENIVEVCQRKE